MNKAALTRNAEFAKELTTLYTDQGAEFASGYCMSLLLKMLPEMPAGKQKEILAQVKNYNGDRMVSVTNCVTGELVAIRRRDRGTVCDPSTERYHTM